ncbi:MAG: hypothetical protein DIU67_004175 [Actinomycetes bacterium]|nr:MAG: hypothetical protein DIU67_08865 [Actinomycetota bacterium]
MWGLVGLVPIAVLLFKADLTLFEAGFRAVAVLGAVMFLRWLGDKAVRGMLATLEPVEHQVERRAGLPSGDPEA